MESRVALVRKADVAEERADIAEAKANRLVTFYRRQAARREEIGDIVLSGAATVGTGIGVHAVRRHVDLNVLGVDLGGLTACGLFLTAGLGGGGKYAKFVGAAAAGMGLEYAIHKMDAPDNTGDVGAVEEEAGDLAPNGRPRQRLLKPVRRGRPPLYGANVRTIDVEYEEIPPGAPGARR